ncbi:MAG: UvrB/UvrC motif-containing protein [Lacunisphaera sp.]
MAAVIAELEDDMQEAANKLEFERAALLRDQINALKTGDYKSVGANRGLRPEDKTPAEIAGVTDGGISGPATVWSRGS